ncbi:ATP-binding protein [Fulvivirga lutimaris]|uniref:ATP-binding protein n=1 Tax=Fulvivirga lutimaris TaxID=1819566 RepID=UPI0012BCD7BE|nr:ATP-binding protein [Fulvivirga lutimaris]MTI39827.1 transporter substrate-binding domain-containing protein [Fulvivirga lutimaris]
MQPFFTRLFFILLLLSTSISWAQPDSWETARKNKAATIDLYWYVSSPFIFQNTDNTLTGIEYELMEGFAQFVNDKYDVKLTLNWIEGDGFKGTYERIKKSQQSGDFGISAFSITDQRKQDVLFSKSYMMDVAVLVSSNEIPVIQSEEEFKKVFEGLTAVSVRGTTYEKGLNDLQQQLGISFHINNIPSDQTVLDGLLSGVGNFAYIDLPLYLIGLKDNPTSPIIRQNLYPMKGQGYGMIMPKNSDWKAIIDEYLNSAYFESIQSDIIERYLENDIYELIKSISSDSNVNADELIILLNKEKEIQNKLLLERALELQENNIIQYVLIVSIIGALLGLIIFYRLYKGKEAAVSNLQSHKEKVELQQNKIEQANAELLTLNEEKNNLIRVLAHDLRSPINQVAGLAEILLMDKAKLSKEQIEIIQQVINSSNRLREMISKILDVDAIESRELNVKLNPIHLNKIFAELHGEYDTIAENKHIKLNFKIDEELSIMGDEVFVNQILDNLISNAIKFSNANSTVVLKAIDVGDKVEIQVADKGPGFTPEDQKKMFKKYQRLSAQPTGGEQSTGLGLSIVKMFTELMGGTISFDSKVGMGTTFKLQFNKS